MANIFTDPRCKALWRFESGALTTDSKGTNTLTANNTPSEDAVDFKEGACCASLASASTEYFDITDANLDAGFPLKSGDSTKVFSACGWYKATSFPVTGSIILAKRNSGSDYTFQLLAWDTGALHLAWVYNAGGSYEDLNVAYTLVTGRWYHFGLIIDGVNKTVHVRIWDDTAGAIVKDISLTPSNALYIGSADFGIGASGAGEAPINGKIDEVVVFSALLNSAEIDKIRAGTYGVYEYSPTGIPVTLTPQSGYYSTVPHEYAGNVQLRLLPVSSYELLPAGPVSSYTAAGSIAASGPCAFESVVPGVSAFTASGSISVGGTEAAYDSITPGVDAFAADGYVAVTGPCVLSSPTVTAFTAVGHIAVTALCQVASVNPGTITPDAYAASGSIAITAPCQVDSILPQVSAFVAAGYIKTGGFFFPMLDVVYPGALTTAFIAAGYVEVSGECGLGISDTPTVSAFVAFTGTGAPCILVGSDSAVGFITPVVAAFEAAGCLLIVEPDEVMTQVFDTWALSGQNFEPSYFTGFNFNSFARFRGKSYGAGEDGVYLLEGDDDNGSEIHTGAIIGPHNFSTDRYKRLRSLRLGKCGDNVQVKVTADDTEGYFDVDEGRVAVSGDVMGKEITLVISDFSELSQVEILPLILARK